ncbi:MAG: hypothetical protein ACSHYB_14675 [Roseibacillus sp.]
MQVNPIELSFPCPACGIRLTIQQTVADGPCPHCHIPIQVELKAGLREVDALPKEDITALKNTFDRRRFRPASQGAKVNVKSHHRLSDHQ